MNLSLPFVRPARPNLVAISLVLMLTLYGCSAGTKNDTPPTPSPATPPTLAPGQVTVGSLLQRIDTAWAGTTSMIATSWTAPDIDPMQGVASPPADQAVTVERTIKPGSRSISLSSGGVVVDEQIAVDGTVFFRGTSVTQGIAPFVDASTWVRINPASMSADSPMGQQIARLTAPASSPYGSVSEDLRARGATKTVQVTQGDRTCDVYTFRDRNDDSGIAYSLAIDSNDLPCFLVLSAGGYADITTWSFDDPSIVITVPAGAIDLSPTPTPAA